MIDRRHEYLAVAELGAVAGRDGSLANWLLVLTRFLDANRYLLAKKRS